MSIAVRFFIIMSACCAALSLAGTGALAATTVYTHSGNFGGWADATDPENTSGVSDGAAGSIPYGGWVAYQTDTSFTTVDFTLDFLGTAPGGSTVYFYVGNSNGAGWFSNLQFAAFTVTAGQNAITSAALSSHCAGIGGCDVFIVQNFSAGTTLSLDGADLTANFVAAATPEPGTWALMILGFAGVAWRLKAERRAQIKKQRMPDRKRVATLPGTVLDRYYPVAPEVLSG